MIKCNKELNVVQSRESLLRGLIKLDGITYNERNYLCYIAVLNNTSLICKWQCSESRTSCTRKSTLIEVSEAYEEISLSVLIQLVRSLYFKAI